MINTTSTPLQVLTITSDEQTTETVVRNSFNRSVDEHPPAAFTGKGYRLGQPKVAQTKAATVMKRPVDSNKSDDPLLTESYVRAIEDYTLSTLSDTITTMKGGAAKIFTYPGTALRQANRAFDNKAAQMWQNYVQTKAQEGSVPLHTTAATLTTVLLAKAKGALTDHIVESVINGLTNPMDLADHLCFMGHPVLPNAYFDTKAPDTAGKLAFGELPSEKPVTYEGLTKGAFKFNMLGLYYKMLGFNS